MKRTVEIKKENNQFVSNISGGEEIGYGNNLHESLKDLAFRIELSSIEGEDEKYANYIVQKQPIAFELFTALYSIMGDKWFELKQLLNKLDEPKEVVLLKLNFLSQFKYVKTDRPLRSPGIRFQLACSEDERREMIKQKISFLQKQIKEQEKLIEISDSLLKTEEVVENN